MVDVFCLIPDLEMKRVAKDFQTKNNIDYVAIIANAVDILIV